MEAELLQRLKENQQRQEEVLTRHHDRLFKVWIEKKKKKTKKLK